MIAPVDIEKNLTQVEVSIARALESTERNSDAVNLVAVSKTHGPEAIEVAIKAGQKIFGENRVQEAEAKWPTLRVKHPTAQLHLIGPLQRNKAALAVGLFDVIETVDRLKLATALARHMEETGRRPNCFIQVNTGEEPQKAGVLPKDADGFIERCRGKLNLPIVGLMCIPPIDEEPALHFALLREIAERNDLTELSMGMSSDFEVAIQFGATYIRVGTAIFGPRSDYWQKQSD
jgi:hypothetical protein